MNQDKINYGKLSSYNLRDTDFIQAFMEEARQQQQSELLQIPELEIEQPDPRKSLEKLTKPTMSHTLKRKDNKQEVKQQSRRGLIKFSMRQVLFQVEATLTLRMEAVILIKPPRCRLNSNTRCTCNPSRKAEVKPIMTWISTLRCKETMKNSLA